MAPISAMTLFNRLYEELDKLSLVILVPPCLCVSSASAT